MTNNDLDRRRSEFFSCVWNHSIDPFQSQFDERRPLSKDEIHFLMSATELVHSTSDDDELGLKLFDLVNGSSERLLILLQVCGLTRNKIISDLKAAAFSLIPPLAFPSSYVSLAASRDAWELAGPYLASRVRPILGPLRGEAPQGVLEALNRATWPGFIRQERAKRSGHQAEYRLATLLISCGIPFQPEEKADNPICPDVEVHSVSFDTVVPNIDTPRVCVKATVHTANIGQYGESKDYLEILEARNMLDERFASNTRPLLLALIDGIGFSSNRAGLDGVLAVADEFCQFRTLWKAIVICSKILEIPLRVELPKAAIQQHQQFLNRFDFLTYAVAKETAPDAEKRVPAGEGSILLD